MTLTGPVETSAYEEEFIEPSRLTAAVNDRRLAVFLPAYNEAGGLNKFVLALREHLVQLRTVHGLTSFTLTIVNDGSTDATPRIADELARLYPEIEVLHNPRNLGYGSTLISGCKHVVGNSGADFWVWIDGDGQFQPHSINPMLVRLNETTADLCIGQRMDRSESDGLFRTMLGKLWHKLSRLVIGRRKVPVTDVDCGLKAGTVTALSKVVDLLSGTYAVVSPELVARSFKAGQQIVETPVRHYPREFGTSTGSNPMVAVKSLIALARLRLKLKRS